MSDELRVLVVEDERLSRHTTRHQLQEAGFVAEVAENAYQALERLQAAPWDIVVSDLRMPGMDGLELLRALKQQWPDVDLIMMTAYGSVETAVEAIREGAADYVTKPFHFEELALRLHRLAEARATRREIGTLRALLSDMPGECGLVGRSPPMQHLYSCIETYAEHSVPVLITGETGTGKELVARALHIRSSRAQKPFVAVNCGSIPRELAESELFGHEKGAFTHALQRRQGSFERANGGTLLLDDVDDLPLEIQVKLLRVLQEGTVSRVGSSQELHVNVRVVSTTKAALSELVASGAFREDLFYRLRGLEIHLSPLRERGEDVLLLAQSFQERQAAREKIAPKTLSPEAVGLLRRHPWPGNVRELQHAIEAALVLCQGEEIQPRHLPDDLRKAGGAREGGSAYFSLHLEEVPKVAFNELVLHFEDHLIQWALGIAGGSQAKAAELLGLPRTTFQSKLTRHKPD
jgi:DNA-binding NtrC family response regulator